MQLSCFHRIALVGCAVAGATLSMAQSYGSFQSATGIYGVDVHQSGLNYTVSLEPGAYLDFSNTHYDITDVFGFWTLSANNPLNASGADQNNWNWNAKSNNGDIAGWTDNSKHDDILPNGSQTFTYSALSQSNVEDYGFHLTLAQSINGGNTAYFTGPLNPVPEPASIACLGVGLFALIRRRQASS